MNPHQGARTRDGWWKPLQTGGVFANTTRDGLVPPAGTSET